MKVLMILTVLMVVSISTAYAQCSCICVNNQKQQVCSNSWDVPTGYCAGWCSN